MQVIMMNETGIYLRVFFSNKSIKKIAKMNNTKGILFPLNIIAITYIKNNKAKVKLK